MENETIKAWVLFEPYYHEIKPLLIFTKRADAVLYARKLEKSFREYRQIKEVEIKFLE